MASSIIPTVTEHPEGGPLVRVALPVVLWLVLLGVAVLAVYQGIRYATASEVSNTLERHFVFRRLEEPVTLGQQHRPLLRWALFVVPGFMFLAAARFFQVLRARRRSGSRVRGLTIVFFTVLACGIYVLLAQWFLVTQGAPGYVWLHVLLPVLLASLFYMGWLYVRDAAGIGWAWATFLATLRGLVYLLVAMVFLLPAWQSWEKTETRSKVVLLLDVSGSMSSKDDLPSESVPVEKLPTRQDKVIRFLTDGRIAFLKNLQEKNPVTIYRFGGRVDEEFRVLEGGQVLGREEWEAWLKLNPREEIPADLPPEQREQRQKQLDLVQQLVGSTNVGESLLAVLNREANNMLQGVIVISDGRSTTYTAQAFEELRARARKAKVPLFAVAVGEYRQPVRIHITDLQAPEQARPDDTFPVRVEVDGEGLPDREITATLEVTSPTGAKRDLPKVIRFSSGAGGPPHAQGEWQIDPVQLGLAPAEGRRAELEEGPWTFRVRIPRDKNEVFVEKEHVSQKATVQVVKKPLRVLLFTGAASHEFQFVRTLLVREVDKRRAELSVCLQAYREGIVQDVPPERLLKQFPNRFEADDGPQVKIEEKYYNLAQYDLIIAFDPDWTQLTAEQLSMLERWVSTHAGGLILVAGPVNTYQLARPGNRDRLKPILDLFPVVLQDARLQGLGIERSASEPWRLNFPGATAEMEFLKLDEESKEPLAGWNEFFNGRQTDRVPSDGPPQRGFYNYYPVDGVKANATVVATFADPRAQLRDGREQPYIVTMPYGSGKVVYLASQEFRRLRQYQEVYHERFWTKLARYAGAGTMTRLTNRGVLVMGREFTAGQFVRLEAQLFGRDLQPLSRNAVPKVTVEPPTGVTLQTTYELKPKPGSGGDWNGWFQGRFRVMAPGEYRLRLQIPETGDTLPGRFLVKEANPEMDNNRPDFSQLYQLASDAKEIFPRLVGPRARSEEVQALTQALQATAARLVPATDSDTLDRQQEPPTEADRERTVARLFFDLASAHLIPQCMTTEVKLQKSRGAFEDLWDRGFTLLEPGTHLGVSHETPLQLAWVLLAVVMLLSAEWLTRKLLRLA